MGPEIIAAIIGAVASLVTTGVGLAVSSNQQDKANDTNVNLANTQYTRAKADAVEAGFSPLVATGIGHTNATVSAPADTGSLFGGLSQSLGANALSAGELTSTQKHDSEEREVQRKVDMIMKDKELAQQRQNLIDTINANKAMNWSDNQTKKEIAEMQKKIAESAQKISVDQFNAEMVYKRHIASADMAKWAKEYERRNREDNRSFGEYIADHVIATFIPTANTALQTAGGVASSALK